MVLGAAVIMLAAQLALVVHPVDHSAQQNEVACTVCSIDNVAKSLPPLTFPTLPQLETCARSARTCVEPRHSAHVSADRIRGPPVIL